MYNKLQGRKWQYQAGASGSITLPVGAFVTQILAHSSGSGTCTIFGGNAIPVGGDTLTMRFMHDMTVVPPTNLTIVFTGTDIFFVEYFTGGVG